MPVESAFKILIIDDNPEIHRDFVSILTAESSHRGQLDESEVKIFGKTKSLTEEISFSNFQIDTASQGQEGFAKICSAIKNNLPYALAFVDVRMPPGWDGLETIERIWEVDPDIQIVICTAYSDYTWRETVERLGKKDNLLILKKPFDSVTVCQLSSALTKKWEHFRELRKQSLALESQVEQLGHEKNQIEKQLSSTREKVNQLTKMIESSSLLSRILEDSVNCSIITTDLDGMILSWNAGAELCFGYKTEEMTGKNNIKMLQTQSSQSADGDLLNLANQLQKHNDKIEKIIECVNKNAEPVLANMVISQYHDENKHLMGYLFIIMDVTEQRRLEKKLIQSNQELEAFAYITSHDLKAPLRAIDQLATWIEEENSDKLEGDSKQNLHLIRQSIIHMYHLIDGILQYSRINHQDAVIDTIEIKTLLNELIERQNYPAGFTFHVSDDMPVLQGDKILLTQVFSNLIDNSVKHHHLETGNIIISVRDLTDFYEFDVMDDGPGIEKEYHQKIFEIFQTLQPKNQTNSAGIGLSIVKKIVESQGGVVTVKSEKQGGSTFSFTWPKSPKR
jgi:PAS domain S-box-containing protein